MLRSIFNIVFFAIELLGLTMIGIAILRFKKTLKEHRKISDDNLLYDGEKLVQNKSIKILIIGISIFLVTMTTKFVLFLFM
ncbi:hypothetical protein [Clostridium sp. UBA4548]|uniref:hypothetical protein n=1 Tax=Clostridium sp. UBA4548 TaxID=1946361 RepID=UPI0025B9762C|nr:hypothetical protein [Clostridium sp. UBA4548]